MPNLIPTPIVDVNGRSTTVHKRPASESPGNRTLAAAKPLLKAHSAPSVMDETVVIKGGTLLQQNSIIMRNRGYFESDYIQNGESGYEWRKDDVEISNGELYEYLMFGIDPVEAAVFHQMNFKPEWFESDDELNHRPPGSVKYNEKQDPTNALERIRDVVTRLRDKGIPAQLAATMVANGASAWNVTHAKISTEQLCDLLGKWRVDGSSNSADNIMMREIIDGRIPFELVGMNSRNDLVRYSKERQSFVAKGRLNGLQEEDPEKYLRVASKAIKSMPGDAPVTDLFRLVDRFGDGVLELKHPKLADWALNGGYFGIEGAKYVEEVQKLLTKSKSKVVGDWKSSTEVGFKYQPSDLEARDLMKLRDAGAPPEQAVDLLVDRGLNITQALSVVQDGVLVALADGAL